MLTIQGRRGLLAVAASLAAMGALTLPGCASLMGERTVKISKEALQAKLATQFPVTRRVLRLLDVSVASPNLQLLPEQGRVLSTFDLQAREVLVGQDFKGKVAMSFALRYEASDQTVRLQQVKVEQVHIDGLAADLQRVLTTLGAQMAESALQDQAVHRFKPEDLRQADRMGYVVGEIRVTAQGLAVQLKPRP